MCTYKVDSRSLEKLLHIATVIDGLPSGALDFYELIIASVNRLW